jgi:hypothetical protein
MSYFFRILIDELNLDLSDPSKVVQSISWKAGLLRNAVDANDYQVEIFSDQITTLDSVDPNDPNFTPFEKLEISEIYDWIDRVEPDGYKDIIIDKLTPELELKYATSKPPTEPGFPWNNMPQGIELSE